MIAQKHSFDPHNYVDIFDETRAGRKGGPYCIVLAVPESKAQVVWERYVKFRDGTAETEEALK